MKASTRDQYEKYVVNIDIAQRLFAAGFTYPTMFYWIANPQLDTLTLYRTGVDLDYLGPPEHKFYPHHVQGVLASILIHAHISAAILVVSDNDRIPHSGSLIEWSVIDSAPGGWLVENWRFILSVCDRSIAVESSFLWSYRIARPPSFHRFSQP